MIATVFYNPPVTFPGCIRCNTITRWGEYFCEACKAEDRAKAIERMKELLARFEAQGITPVFVDFKGDEKSVTPA